MHGEDVEVQEATQVNFLQVKEHLRNGGSVFITSKDHKKQFIQKPKLSRTTTNQEEIYGVLFRQHLRSS